RGERRGGAARVLPPREDERRGTIGALRAGAGAGSGGGLAVLAPGERGQLLELVLGLDAADRPRARAHDDRVRDRAVLRVANAAQERAGGHAGRRDEDVVAANEVVRRQHAIRVDALLHEPRALVVVARPQPALQRAAEALDRGS